MDTNLNLVVDQVSKDKGIEPDVLQRALEEAILVAAKRTFGAERNLKATYNVEKGAVDLTQTITVVANVEDAFNEISVNDCVEREIEVEVGDEMVFPVYYLDQDASAAKEQDGDYGDILKLKTYRRGFGRIAAQTAKQVIIQRIRDAERGMVFSEYKDRKGELVTGIVRRFERGNLIVDLGRAEAVLPLREQCPRESYRAGDRVQAFVIEVQEHSRGPQIILSRTTPDLLIKLFELEVPEIYEGIVRIESAAREPGARAKIAVSSSDRDVDPVGACVGMKGSRVQAVVQELRGEKIDIVPYSEDPATFVCNALQPAEVSRVLIDEANHAMEIIVPDDQLSLAIGRKGQNVRLASHLAGWKLDIHSESRIQEIKERAWASLSKVEGCNEFLIQTLYNHGIRSAQQLLESEREYLMQFPGVGEETIDAILQSAVKVAEMEKQEEEHRRLDAQQVARAAEAGRKLQELLGLNDDGRLRKIRGVGENTYKQLTESGFDKVELIAEVEVPELAEQAGISDKKAKQLKFAAMQWLKQEGEIQSEAEECGVTVVDGMVRIPGQELDEEPEASAPAVEELAPVDAEPAIANSKERGVSAES
ncbi:MAG: transcription termination factor NusA [Deltaproteobacteria bacterium RIFOXYA12_FULL_58_15]|nr:MAG: transcription termination factor NusA [Deltaproteobacteria bacterium RIFOXYA12_FULL_58_15]OGR12430.1 MAG: transcription termination factor NusA [Deltaproteobacteria bacterium RIFOXYB12_FULL_58_9]